MTSRRAFLAASIAATASPFVAAAQPRTKTWRIGYLAPVSPSAGARLLESFRQGLRELGYAEGQNISIDYRWAEGRPDQFSALAVELTQLKQDCESTRDYDPAVDPGARRQDYRVRPRTTAIEMRVTATGRWPALSNVSYRDSFVS